MPLVNAHQIFSDSDLQFSNGSHFGTFYLICSPAYIDSHSYNWYEYVHMHPLHADCFLVTVT